MSRLTILTAGFLALGSACALYGLTYETRLLETRVNAQSRAVDKAEADIAILKAERAYLSRPERIETLARAQGLVPIKQNQYLRVGEASDHGVARLLDRQRDDDR